jgi:hypothetical protein
MSNITSTTLKRITSIAEINTRDYYLVKFRIQKRYDCIGYFLNYDEIRKIGIDHEIDPVSKVFRRVWQRSPRRTDKDAYNEWVNIDEFNRINENSKVYVKYQVYSEVTFRDFMDERVLVYSFGKMEPFMNEGIDPDITYQYYQQRQRKKKLNKEIIQRDDTNGNANIPSLQYLSTMALPDDDMNFIKNKTILEPYRIKKYLSSQNAGKSKKQRKMKKQQKTKRRRKI